MNSSPVAQTLASLLLIAISINVAATASQYKVATVSESTLREWAITIVLPTFPEESKKDNSQGVAVAQVTIDEAGAVTRAEILEAPDDAIAEAVKAGTMKWTFQPGTDDRDGKAVRLKGKLTFYYVIENGKAFVKHPKQFARTGRTP
ncbi:MAG TPA: TonB family protein [Pyrinomonadaceae bacterium]|nr:TonB family protein [Pyrinomonadaceae bacterium]